MSKVQAICVLCFLSYAVVIGALVFCRGFLLNRQVITEKAGPCLQEQNAYTHQYHNGLDVTDNVEGMEKDQLLNVSGAANWCHHSPVFKKAILILVDALRYDFVQRMDFLREIIKEGEEEVEQKDIGNGSGPAGKRGKQNGSSSCLFKFVADPPTTTMQRLKALMTGTMPTFIDASANFNSYEVEEDSLIHQFNVSGKRIAFLGDDTWLSLFPSTYFTSPFVEAYPSFNAWDLDTVDRGVNHTLRTKLFPGHPSPSSDQWDVLITHILGVDHCGHRYGPSHPEMVRKLREADEIIKFVHKGMSTDTLLVVFGDHGMTPTGDHGGDSKDETDAAVIFISKMGQESAEHGVAVTYNSPHHRNSAPFLCPSFSSGISQIDLVPTLATLLGVPIPYSSLGQLIPNFLRQGDIYTDAIISNAAQVHRYISRVGLGSNSLNELYLRVQETFKTFLLQRGNVTSRAKVKTMSQLYLNTVKQVALSQWTQFNVPMIYTGVGITLLALFALLLYFCCSSQLRPSQYTVLCWLWPSLPLWSVLLSHSQSQFPFQTYSPSSNLAAIIVSTLAGLTMFILCLIWKLIQSTSQSRLNFSLEEVVSLCSYLLTCLAVFSNSFVINEGSTLGGSLLLLVFLHLILLKTEDTSTPHLLQVKRVKCSLVCGLMLGVLLRTCSIFLRCREELQECTEQYLLHKQLASLPDSWLVHKYVRYSIALVSLAIFVVAFRLWMLYRKCLFNKRPAAYVAKFIPSLLVVLLGVFWALQGLPFISSGATKLRPLLNYFPWVFQASTLISLVLVWLKPLLSPNSSPVIYHRNPVCSRCSSSKGLAFKDARKPTPTQWSKGTHNNGLQKLGNGTASSPPPILKHDDMEKQSFLYEDPTTVSDSISSALLLFCTLVIVLLCQVTSVGMTAAVSIVCPYVIICLVGIFRGGPTWISAISWTLASQYLFYGTGHQPIFSAIPWDSAFLSSTDGQSFTDSSDNLLTWARPCLAILGNLHVSQITFSLALPLLTYWTSGTSCPNLCSRLQSCRSLRRQAFQLSGKFIFLHGLKLACCMICAGYHRRHLMVWKIFAPKFIFESVSFIVTTFCTILSLVFVTRIDYLYHRDRHKLQSKSSTN